MDYVLYFLSILWYTLGAVVLCGLFVALCEWLFRRLAGGKVGRVLILGTSIIGTPVHECGHALMCLIFGHKIRSMCLWNPKAPDGNLGYVTHSFNMKNPYHQIGNLFIGIGPIFSGLAVTAALLALCFPETWSTYLEAAVEVVGTGRTPWIMLWEGFKLWPHMLGENSVALWLKIPAIFLMLSVSLHVRLSLADIKGSLYALPLYLALVLIFTVITSLMGRTVMSTIQDGLAVFLAVTVSLFTIVLSFSVALVLVALIIWALRRLFTSVLIGKQS